MSIIIVEEPHGTDVYADKKLICCARATEQRYIYRMMKHRGCLCFVILDAYRGSDGRQVHDAYIVHHDMDTHTEYVAPFLHAEWYGSQLIAPIDVDENVVKALWLSHKHEYAAGTTCAVGTQSLRGSEGSGAGPGV